MTFAERDANTREPFLDLLAADTLTLAQNAEPARLVPDRKLATFLGVGAASLCVLVWMILAGPGYLGHGAALLWAATPRDGSAPFYDLQVTPGDISVRRNADQIVTAQLIGLQTDAVRLYARYESTSKWDQVPMLPQAGVKASNLSSPVCLESVEYYVEAGPLHSRHFNIRVLDLPGVKNVRVTYRYPEWTHMQNVVEERGGDLRAVEGTRKLTWKLRYRTNRCAMACWYSMTTSRLNFRTAGLTFTKARFAWRRTASITSPLWIREQPVRLSNDFFIEARKAEPPNVIIARPTHDYRANPIEEVTVAVKADEMSLVSLI